MAKPEKPDEDDRKLRERLDKLSQELESRRAPEEPAGEREGAFADAGQGMSLGLRAVADLLAGILVGAGIGWLLDRWLSTKPWLMIVFLFLGTAAGVLNVMRAAGGGRGRGSGNRGS